VFVKIKLPEQLGLHAYAVSTHPEELVLEPPLKKSWIRLWQGSHSVISKKTIGLEKNHLSTKKKQKYKKNVWMQMH